MKANPLKPEAPHLPGSSAFLLKVFLFLALGLVSLYYFLKITHNVLYDTSFLLNTDNYLVRHLQPESNPALRTFLEVISFFGSWKWMAFLSVLLLLACWLHRRLRPYAFPVMLVTVGSIAACYLLKIHFQRPRPEATEITQAFRTSYPSGHAFVGLAIYGIMVYFFWVFSKNRYLNIAVTVFYLLLILGIGFSRVYLKEHYLSDVLGGYAGGIFWLFFSIVTGKLSKKYWNKKLGS